MNIGIIGLGLIGGSFALTARKFIKGSILYGEDHNKLHQNQFRPGYTILLHSTDL